MRQVVVDTNIFLRLFLNDIPKQVREVERLLKQAIGSEIKLYVPQIVIFELNFILDKYYHFQKQEIIDKLKPTVQSSYLVIQDRTIFNDALKIYEGNAISLADSFMLAYAKENEVELFTFDQKLQKLQNRP